MRQVGKNVSTIQHLVIGGSFHPYIYTTRGYFSDVAVSSFFVAFFTFPLFLLVAPVNTHAIEASFVSAALPFLLALPDGIAAAVTKQVPPFVVLSDARRSAEPSCSAELSRFAGLRHPFRAHSWILTASLAFAIAIAATAWASMTAMLCGWVLIGILISQWLWRYVIYRHTEKLWSKRTSDIEPRLCFYAIAMSLSGDSRQIERGAIVDLPSSQALQDTELLSRTLASSFAQSSLSWRETSCVTGIVFERRGNLGRCIWGFAITPPHGGICGSISC